MVPIEYMVNANPIYLRSDLGNLSELKADIRRRGQQAPIIVDSTYLVIDGARRLEVAKKLGHTKILTIATKDFNFIADLMVAAHKRHEGGEIHKPKSYLDIMELVPVLRSLYLPLARTKAVTTRKNGRPKKSDSEYRQAGVIAHMSEMFGISIAVTEQLSRAANVLQQARMSRKPGALERVLNVITECEAAGTPYPLPNRMKQAMQDPVPPRTTNATIVREQKGRIGRMLSALDGAILALPGSDDLDPGHSPDDLEAWFREVGKHAMVLRTFRSVIKEQLDKMREDSRSDQSD